MRYVRCQGYRRSYDLSQIYKKTITYSPKFIDKVKWAEAEKQTPFGFTKISYDTKKEFIVELTIPKGLKGIVKLPKGKYLAKKENGLSIEFNKETILKNGNYKITKIGGDYEKNN